MMDAMKFRPDFFPQPKVRFFCTNHGKSPFFFVLYY